MPEEPANASEETDLLERLRRGDDDAFGDLVRLYRRDVWRIAWRLTGDAAEADDLAQETFLRAWRALPGFRGEAALRTWLLRIATNLGLNVATSARVVRREDVALERAAGGAEHGGEAAILRRRREERLGPAIANLPPRQRATLMLRVNEELPFKEIARVMGTTTGTAKANFFHAVAALRKALEDLT